MNSPLFVPVLWQRAAALLIFFPGILMVVVHALMVARGAERAPIATRARWVAPTLVGAFFAFWLASAVVLADGTEHAETDRRVQLLSAGLALGPLVIALVALASSRTLRAINEALPPHWLVAVQGYRVLGVIFLFPYLYYGALPEAFAWPAATGDFITGALAPVVAWRLARNRPGAFGWAVAWNLFGVLDLIVAPASAVLSQARVLQIYPLSVVPLFLGPPLGILTHVLSLRNLFASRRASLVGRSETLPRAVTA